MPTHQPSKSRALICLLLTALQIASAGAGTISFSKDSLNARTSLNFVGRANVRATVPKGSTGEVLERWKLPSGNYGIKVKLSTLGDEKTSLEVGEEVWVYYHTDPTLRRIELADDEGQKTENAEDGKWAVALSTFRTQKSAPLEVTAAPVKETPTVCDECNVNLEPQIAAKPLPVATVNEVSQIVEEVKAELKLEATKPVEEDESVPTLDVGVEEVLAFIVKDQKSSLSKSQLKKIDAKMNRLIAQTIVDESAKQGVPLSLVLGIIRKESHFYFQGHSPAGARGLMQIMPATYFDRTKQKDYERLYEPALNIKIGIGVIAEHISYFNGDVSAALASYNMGRGGYLRYRAGKRTMPLETQKYVPGVLAYQAQYIAYEKTSRTSLSIASNN